LAAGLGIYTAILFKEVYDEKNSDAAKVADAAGGLFNKVSDTFGLQEKVNPLKNLNIRFYCYGTVIGAAALQLLTSLLLLGCSGAKVSNKHTKCKRKMLSLIKTLLSILHALISHSMHDK